MGRNGYDTQCINCRENFRGIFGTPIECPKCGFVASASPEPIRISLEREGAKGSPELSPNLPKTGETTI